MRISDGSSCVCSSDLIAFGSGMGAASTIVFALCSPGDRIVAQASMFSVTNQLLTRTCERFGIEVALVDAFDADALRDAVAEKPTQLVWAETPANPAMGIVDLVALGSTAGPFSGVDSTPEDRRGGKEGV